MLKMNQCYLHCPVIPCKPQLRLSVPSQSIKNGRLPFPNPAVPAWPRKAVVCSAEVGSPEKTPSSTSVLDYVLGRGIYQYMTVLLALNAVGLIFAAPMVAEKYIGFCLRPVSELLFRAMGSVSFPAVAICYCMQSAVAADRLDSPTYKRLSFALPFTLMLATLSTFLSVSKGVAFSKVSLYLSTVAHLLPAISFFKLYGMSTLGGIVPGLIAGVSSVFQPDTINSGIYSMFTIATMCYGLYAFCCPEKFSSLLFTFPADALTEHGIRAFASMVILISTACFTLKDAADRGRLGFTTFKTLNFAVALGSIAKFSSTWYVCEMASRVAEAAGETTVCMMTTAGGASSMGLFLFLGLFCGFNAIAAKRN